MLCTLLESFHTHIIYCSVMNFIIVVIFLCYSANTYYNNNIDIILLLVLLLSESATKRILLSFIYRYLCILYYNIITIIIYT